MLSVFVACSALLAVAGGVEVVCAERGAVGFAAAAPSGFGSGDGFLLSGEGVDAGAVPVAGVAFVFLAHGVVVAQGAIRLGLVRT